MICYRCYNITLVLTKPDITKLDQRSKNYVKKYVRCPLEPPHSQHASVWNH